MQNLSVFSLKSLFFSLTSLGKTRQAIRKIICIFLAIVNLKILPREFLGPSNLPGTPALDISELVEIVIVNEDKDLKFIAFQVVTLSLKGFNNGQEFIVVSFVLSLYRDYLPKQKGYGILLPRIGG